MYPSTSTQQPAAICALKSPADAIHILEAVRLGLVPRVTRRLTGHERSMIRPGTVWVWEEEETNMRRWTDGRRWGASRVGGGGFLVYTESSDNLSPPPSRGAGTDYMGRPTGHAYTPYGRSAPKAESLIKQTYSTTMTHPETGKAKKFHVVAYSSKHNPQGDANNPLPLPQQLPLLSTIKIAPGIWPEWEHRRDPEYSRRATSFPPVPSASMSAPVTATASPDGEQFDQYRGRSPPREAYTARASPTHLQQQRYNQPYAQPVMNASYGNRQISLAPYPPPDQRYHPYHDPNRNRPYPQQPVAQAPAAGTAVPSMPGQPAVPQEMYFDDRRFSQQQPRMSPGGFAPPYDLYGRPYRRDQYFEEMPPPGQYYDPNLVNVPRSPEHKTHEAAQHVQDRHHPLQQQPMIPSVETTAPQQSSGRTSPKMSIDSSLLNPSNAGQAQAVQSASASPQATQPGGLTLPPLRLAIDDRNPPANGSSGPASPSGYTKVSPRTSADGSQGSTEPVKGEDARQLGELGKRVPL